MARPVAAALDRRQRERAAFASAVCDLSRQPDAVDALLAGGAVAHLRLLAEDPVAGIACAATQSLGRLASHSQSTAEALARDGFHIALVRRGGAARAWAAWCTPPATFACPHPTRFQHTLPPTHTTKKNTPHSPHQPQSAQLAGGPDAAGAGSEKL